MRKSGLDWAGAAGACLQLETIKEKANALHLAGKRLRLCLDVFSRTDKLRISRDDLEVLLDAIADSVLCLLDQRRLLGFEQGNLDWVCKHYSVPEEALARLGARSSRRGGRHSPAEQ